MTWMVALQAHNGQYVCAEDGGGRELVANRAAAQQWETFTLERCGGGETLHSGDAVTLRAASGQYVCAEDGGGRELVANRAAGREWETFTVEKPGGGEIKSGDAIALRTCNGQYVCAEDGGGRELVANRAAAKQWETFKFQVLAISNVTKRYVPSFTPSANCLHFANSFADVSYKFEILGTAIHIGSATNGMCGGMAFAARDYFEARMPPATDTTAPSSGVLFEYLCRRLQDSFNLPLGLKPYLELMSPTIADHDTWVRRGRAWVMIKEEWPKIRSDIDHGHPSPLGLIQVVSVNPGDLGHNHQVLVYGYELCQQDLTLHIYDPNYPDNDNVTLSLNLGSPEHTTPVRRSHGSSKIYCFFRTDYDFKQPPQSTVPNRPYGLSASWTSIDLSRANVHVFWMVSSPGDRVYEVQRRSDQTASWSTVAHVAAHVPSTEGANHIDTGVPKGKVYYYRIRARNDVGDSLYSDELRVECR